MRLRFTFLLTLIFSLNLSAQDIYDIARVREVKIEFTQSNWDVLLDSFKQEGKQRLIGKVIFDGVTYDSVGIRYKGNSSYFNVRNSKSSKLPFNLKADYVKDDQLFKGGYKTLKLSNVFRDPSFLREVLAYDLARKYMPAPKANYIKLYVNNKLLGLYNNTESIDKYFLRKHYGCKKADVLLKCDPDWNAKLKKGCSKGEKASLLHQGEDPECYAGNYELKTKSKKGWKSLINFTKVLNKSPEKVDEILNIDQTLWMHAFNNITVNLDSYTGKLCHNYYLFKDTFDVFHPLVWDMNMAFGGFRHDGTGTPLTNEKLQELSPFIHYKSPNRPLISKILGEPLNRKIYIAHMKTIIKENFDNGAFEQKAREVQRVIDSQVMQDNNKLYSYEAYKGNLNTSQKAGKTQIIGILELMKKRITYLKSHPLFVKEQPYLSELRHQKSSDEIKISVRARGADKVWLMFKTSEFGPFQKAEMSDSGIDGDTAANDNVFTKTIILEPGAKYYTVAENNRTAVCLPAKASSEAKVIN